MNNWKDALHDIKKMLETNSESIITRNPAHNRKHKEPLTTLPEHWANDCLNGSDLRRNTGASVQGTSTTTKSEKLLQGHGNQPESINQFAKRPTLAVVADPTPAGIPETFHFPRRKALSRQSYYKAPETWVIEGARTQYAPKTSKPQYMDIVIGLDFGTSYTKAALGLKDIIIPVSWEGVSAAPEQYLLASEYSLMADGTVQLGQALNATDEQVRQRLKHPFINPAVSSDSIARASIFIAIVLRYVRAWVFHHHASKIGEHQIRWHLNIGAPSNGLETEFLKAAYTKLASVAWTLSLNEYDINPSKAIELTRAWQSNQISDELTSLAVVPEFVAQIAGYVQSPQRRRGLHALVDVGGGTLDVVTFIVHQKNDEDVFPFLVPEVKPLGTQMLYQNRLVDAPPYDESILPDDLQPVLNAETFSRITRLPEAHIRKRDDLLLGAVMNTVRSVFNRTRQKRYRLSEAWRDGVPTFLTGGGAKADGYNVSVTSGGQHHTSVVNLMPLPFHPRLADFKGKQDDFQRISVACGLAQDSFSLGKIIPAKDVEDDMAPIVQTVERPDRDELYPH